MSLWTIPWLCKYSRPSISWQKYLGEERGGDKIKPKSKCVFGYRQVGQLPHAAQTNLYHCEAYCGGHAPTRSLVSYCRPAVFNLNLGWRNDCMEAENKYRWKTKKREGEDLPVSLKYWKPFLWDAVQHFLHPTNAILHHHIRGLAVKGVRTNQKCICFIKDSFINKWESGPLIHNVSV